MAPGLAKKGIWTRRQWLNERGDLRNNVGGAALVCKFGHFFLLMLDAVVIVKLISKDLGGDFQRASSFEISATLSPP